MLQTSPTSVLKARVFEEIRFGNWQYVFTQLYFNQDLIFAKDPIPTTYGWTLLDHASYQRRGDVFSDLVQFIYAINIQYNKDNEVLQQEVETCVLQINQKLIFSRNIGISLLNPECDEKYIPEPGKSTQPPIGSQRSTKRP